MINKYLPLKTNTGVMEQFSSQLQMGGGGLQHHGHNSKMPPIILKFVGLLPTPALDSYHH
jgi:hypothetical protein